MKIFKSTTLTWKQLGALKWGVFLIGLAVGSMWPEVFVKYAKTLLIVGLFLSLYVGYVWMKQ